MRKPMPKTANEVFRDFTRFTGDGLPGAPAGRPLPIGDPSSGVHNPLKRDIRDWANGFSGGFSDMLADMDAQFDAAIGRFDRTDQTGFWVQSVAALEADTALTMVAGSVDSVAVGDLVQTRSEGFAYEVVSSAPDITTAGGVKLKVLPRGGMFNVRAFGAKGDGIADDTAAMQRWLNAGGCVLPPGTHRLSAALNMPVGSLHGAGMGETNLVWAAGAASSGIRVTSGSNTSPTTISGLSLITEGDGAGTALLVNYSGNIGSTTPNVQPRTAARLRVRDVQMKGSGSVLNTGWQHHLDMVSVVGAHISGCAVEGGGRVAHSAL